MRKRLLIIASFCMLYSSVGYPSDLVRSVTKIVKQPKIEVTANIDRVKTINIDMFEKKVELEVSSGNIVDGNYSEESTSVYIVRDIPAHISSNTQIITISSGAATLEYAVIGKAIATSTDGKNQMYASDHYTVSGKEFSILDSGVIPDGTELKVSYEYESDPAKPEFTTLTQLVPDGTKNIADYLSGLIWSVLISRGDVAGTIAP